MAVISIGLFVSAIGLLALLGWGLGLRALASFGGSFLPAAPDTALCFIIVGTVLAGSRLRRDRPRLRIVFGLALALIGLYGSLKVIGSLFGLDLSLSGLLLPVSEWLGPFPLGRMSPYTGALFLAGSGATGLHLDLVRGDKSWAKTAGGVIGILMTMAGLVALLGYLFEAPLLYGGTTIPLAAPTSLGFLSWGLAILVSAGPAAPLTRRFWGWSTDARLMRSVVPVVALSTLAAGVVQERAARGSYNVALVSAAITLLFLALTVLVVLRASQRIFRRAGEVEAELRRVDEEKRQSELMFRRLHDSIRDGYTIADLDGRYLASNPAFRELVGYSSEELAAMSVFDLTVEKWRAPQMRIMEEQVFSRGYSEIFEKEYRRKDGSMVPVELHIFLIRDELGRGVGTCSVVRDISERKLAEASLTESEERFRTIFENAGIGMALVDEGGRFLKVNTSLTTMLDYTKAELMGLSFMEITHPDDREPGWDLYLSLMAGSGDSYQVEKRYLRKDGRVIWARLTASVLCIPSAPCSIIGMVEDITSRRAHEDLLRHSLGEKEALLREIHHRVKNNLQLITSLLSLQGASLPGGPTGDAIRDALLEASGRVGAMADVHELVYLSKDFSGIEFGAYMESIARNLVDGSPTQSLSLRLELGEARMPLELAIPCGLIVNEAISNLLKYAYPVDWKGERLVSLGLELNRAGNIRIIISDRGVGLPAGLSWTAVGGLGFKIMRILTEQVDGRLNVSSEGGVVVEVEIPPARHGGGEA